MNEVEHWQKRSAKLEAMLLHVRASLRAVAVHSVQAGMREDARKQVESIDAVLSPDQPTEHQT